MVVNIFMSRKRGPAHGSNGLHNLQPGMGLLITAQSMLWRDNAVVLGADVQKLGMSASERRLVRNGEFLSCDSLRSGE